MTTAAQPPSSQGYIDFTKDIMQLLANQVQLKLVCSRFTCITFDPWMERLYGKVLCGESMTSHCFHSLHTAFEGGPCLEDRRFLSVATSEWDSSYENICKSLLICRCLAS